MGQMSIDSWSKGITRSAAKAEKWHTYEGKVPRDICLVSHSKRSRGFSEKIQQGDKIRHQETFRGLPDWGICCYKRGMETKSCSQIQVTGHLKKQQVFLGLRLQKVSWRGVSNNERLGATSWKWLFQNIIHISAFPKAPAGGLQSYVFFHDFCALTGSCWSCCSARLKDS